MKFSRYLDFSVLFSCFMSLLFSILLLTSGYKHGVLNKIAIAQYSYNLNNTLASPSAIDNSSTYSSFDSTVLTQQEITDGIHWWVFTVHYLSICAGYVGGSPTPLNVFLECESKPAGYTFRTDDPFILNFQRNCTQFPVVSIPLDVIHTDAPFVTLVLGIVFSILALGLLVCQVFGMLRWVSPLAFLVLAAAFMITSSALVTSIASERKMWNGYSNWVSCFLGLAWASVSFIIVAFAGKAVDSVSQRKEKNSLEAWGWI
ncbi:hypothetical protein BKA61DRAFT_731415 [Leptodontidium sp. MPI-SDFR-AT-0119]|nr:hypothetical protein BKA61DRAFT_731415 [Leptodontidium sp. MPI-SDFR-AT-0119]